MATLRFKMVEKAIGRKALDVKAPESRPSEYFGEKVFGRKQMRKYLHKDVYKALVDSMDNGTPLSSEIADQIAAGMRNWALEMGATHYTHWFQPLTGSTAEKHDGFIDTDNVGGAVEEFSGKLLLQQEPDASSFPNGGIRNTFEARGYSAWDPSSPAFIVDTTLCIPTIFVAYTGESLDYKTPLLRSVRRVSDIAAKVCRHFDPQVTKVKSFLGWEQEYFLIDEGLWAVRPDLMLTGRTLIGHESAKNQQLEDHYFGSIPNRVMSFMKDLEYECLKLGIPAKTRHNEVAPNQFELAPIYEEANLANDHNQLLVSVMNEVAIKHGFRVLLHEKPFKGVNGSGKHCNWSLGTDTGINLFSPGKTEDENLLFITFLVNTIMAVYKNNALFKASISTATNTHRLGANEAPPAIISVFLGSQLSQVLDDIENGNPEALALDGKGRFEMAGISHISDLVMDNTDRNRTSPFAFTGNRFEFRAVGSSDNCARSIIVLNSTVAHQLAKFEAELSDLLANGGELKTSILSILKGYIAECKAIRFDGNGYSDEWKEEAFARGLDCETSVPKIIDNFTSQSTIDMFSGVLSPVELHARSEVYWEMYTKKIQIEARLLGDLSINHIIPAASRYQALLLEKVSNIKNVMPADKFEQIAKSDLDAICAISEHVNIVREHVENMVEQRKIANIIEDEREKAIAYHDNVVPEFEIIRRHIDRMELIVDNEIWPLPKYREMLFIR